ncbi:glyoxalase [Bacillus thuringiensis serovar tolworthi]|uniref:Glyoxalase n=1 Tax=Bacillus thuringiensis subsp. tolworthi TaxID=1442 RepID=A0A9W3ZZ56_BACTO|nr:glyoxalase [Bacillus thuringiensis serovar tolworthi]
MSQMILKPLSRNILRRPRVILQVSHESKKIKFKHTIRGVVSLLRKYHLLPTVHLAFPALPNRSETITGS